MPIIYNKLFHMLIDRNIKKGELQEMANITPSIMARLGRNETVRTDTIGKVCKALHCQPGDIMEYIEIDELIDTKTGEKVKEHLVTWPDKNGKDGTVLTTLDRINEY